MRVSIKPFIFMVGVTLSVAPTFSSVHAQQTTQQANMLLEIQALRAEIAELRDMVERQAYQLRQMQQNSQTTNQSNARYGPPTAQDGVSGGLIGSAGESSGEISESVGAQYPIEAGQDAGQTPTASDDAGIQIEPRVAENSNAAFPTTDADFYRADEPSNNEPDSVLRTQEVVNQDDSYPPVEERKIGSAANKQPQLSSPVGTQSPSDFNEARAQQTPASPVVPKNPVNAPTQSAVANNQTQSDQPENFQGAENTVVSAGTGTGVIAIPTPADVVSAQPQVADSGFENNQSVVGSKTTDTEQGSAVNQSAAVEAPVVLSEQEQYQQGFDLLKQSKHAQAVDVFKQQIANYPDGSYADDAHYWIAESMYVNRSLDNSKLYFRAIIDKFVQSPRLPDAMLKTAYIEQEQGNQIEALILLQEIIQYHPRSNAAISAKNRLAEIN